MDHKIDPALLEKLINREESTLSEWGFRSRDSRGRAHPEPPGLVRTPFQRDRDRIIHSKAFRRLKHKTQVFLAPAGDHFRTRLTHTLETTQIARGIGRALGLNEDLVEAIGLGHDLGHTPFGHAGEKVLNEWCLENGMKEGFQHHIQSVRIVEVLENDGRGLNLTRETVEGILKHTKGSGDYSVTFDPDDTLHWEGRVVKISDRMAYVNHDLQDALAAGLVQKSDVPGRIIKVLGDTNRERISSMVFDIVATSLEEKRLAMSPEMEHTINDLKNFLFENVYFHETIRSHDVLINNCLRGLLDLYSSDADVFDKNFDLRAIVDYVAGMTDRYAIGAAEKFLDTSSWDADLNGIFTTI